jgi:hypothetical protein
MIFIIKYGWAFAGYVVLLCWNKLARYIAKKIKAKLGAGSADTTFAVKMQVRPIRGLQRNQTCSGLDVGNTGMAPRNSQTKVSKNTPGRKFVGGINNINQLSMHTPPRPDTVDCRLVAAKGRRGSNHVIYEIANHEG